MNSGHFDIELVSTITRFVLGRYSYIPFKSPNLVQSKARGELQGKNLTKLGLKTERCDNIKKIKKGCEMKYAS